MRRPFIAGNWKMNLNRADSVKLAAALAEKIGHMVVDLPRLPPISKTFRQRLGQAKPRGGQDAAVSGDQLAILGDKTRHRPAELGNAGGELGHLIVVMGLWIGGIGRQLGQRPGLDPLGGEAQRHEGRVSRFVDTARGPDPGLHAGSSGHDARSKKAAVCRGLQRLALRRRVERFPYVPADHGRRAG